MNNDKKFFHGDMITGSQTFFQKINMASQSIIDFLRLAVIIYFISFILFCIPVSSYSSLEIDNGFGQKTIKDLIFYGQAKIRYSIGMNDIIYDNNGEKIPIKIHKFLANAQTNEFVNMQLAKFMNYLLLSLYISIGFFVIFFILAKLRGKLLGATKFERGGAIDNHKNIAKMIKKGKKISSPTLCGLPYPDRAETQGTLILGAQGTGKTQALLPLVMQLIEKGHKVIIYDKLCAFTELFYTPGRDIILNPLDNRSAHWSPFAELKDLSDFRAISAGMIPESTGTQDPFWQKAAQTIFATTLKRCLEKNQTSPQFLADLLLTKNLEFVAQYLENSDASNLIDPKNDKTALSVRATITTYLSCLRLFQDAPDNKYFSVFDWVTNGQAGILFLTSQPKQHELLKPTISTYINIMMMAIQSLPRDINRRIWFIGDEIASLQRIPELVKGLQEVRQYGGAIVLGLQIFSALEEIYGQKGAETISGLCQNRVMFGVPDYKTAIWCSQQIGSHEITRKNESLQISPGTLQRGVTVTEQRITEKIVMPEEFQTLKPNNGYVKMATMPYTKFSQKITKLPLVADGFQPNINALKIAIDAIDNIETQTTITPDTAQPDNTQPNTAQPDNTQPDTAQPDNTQPETGQPDTKISNNI